MPHNPDLEALHDLQKRLAAERSRTARQLAAAPAGGTLPDDALQRLAMIHGAAAALAEEIDAHTPRIGHGGEE